jgi:hypothetical protein
MVNAGANPVFVLGPQKQREDHPAGLEEDDLLVFENRLPAQAIGVKAPRSGEALDSQRVRVHGFAFPLAMRVIASRSRSSTALSA